MLNRYQNLEVVAFVAKRHLSNSGETSLLMVSRKHSGIKTKQKTMWLTSKMADAA